MSVADRISPSLEAALGDLGFVVEDLSVMAAGRRRVVRVAVDRDLGAMTGDTTEVVPSLTLDEVADASRAVSDTLDVSGAMGEQPYTLEVTSPGVDRPLTEPRHFRRNATRMLTATPHEGEPVTGRLVRAGEDGITLEVPPERKTPGRTVELAYADLLKAVVQVEFSRPGPGSGDQDEGEIHDENDDVDETGDPAVDQEQEA